MAKKRKMFLGGIDPISLGMGAISLYSAAKQKQDYNNQINNAKELAKQDKLKLDTESLNDINANGINKYFYKTGGIAKINARNGLLPLNSNGTVFEVIGPSHAQGGVDIGNIEVEGGEVVKREGNNLKVLSDAESILGYSPADNAKITGNFEEEFNKQENIKDMKGLPNNKKKANLGLDTTLKYPDKFKSLTGNYNPSQSYSYEQALADSKLPQVDSSIIKSPVNKQGMNPDLPNMLIDNVVNLGLTALTPKISNPILQKPIRLESDIDTSPQLDNIKESQISTNRFVDRNISDSNVASSIIQQSKNNAVSQTNEVNSSELNKELELRNQNKLINAQVESNNIEKLNNNQQLNLERNLGINSALSTNMANLSSDITTTINNKNIKDFDNQRMLTTLLKDNEGNLANAVLIGNSFDDTINANYESIINSPYINPKLKDAIIRKYGANR